jgi:hypothetical protein
VRRRWAGVFFAALGFGLLPWAFWLGYSLPSRQVAHHWDLAWAGFDIVLAAALLGTSFALLTGRPVVRSFAAATGALLLADAWFDVVTAADASERLLAVAFALFGEIPLAILCFVLARPAPRR